MFSLSFCWCKVTTLSTHEEQKYTTFFQKALDRQFISGQNGDGGHRRVAKKQGPPTSGTTWTGPKGVTVDDVTT